ncbi:carboxyl transferase domain-containing protein [Streptomyces sp. FBKL.4005]|uniref:carboxyl transferase domain-containing protein n=1 Tax=Streptomyces sp. FBKL.4005 TaxID=2015515 RepID=UPI0016799C6A|nr:carboxyl transferase domain-containing protein [Streptomyces sp. FBKL.4005]
MPERLSARETLALVADADSFRELPAPARRSPPDGPLGWQGYDASRARAAARTGEQESVVCGTASVEGTRAVLIAFEFGYLGGSLGERTGDRLEAAYVHARAHRLPVVPLIATGGSRMQEGMLALTQLQRVARQSALTREAGLPQIAVLRDPTTGGGWATLGAGADIVLALPGAQVGFAGSRVRPPDTDPTAYTAESQVTWGSADAVVKPADLKPTLGTWLRLLTGRGAGAASPGAGAETGTASPGAGAEAPSPGAGTGTLSHEAGAGTASPGAGAETGTASPGAGAEAPSPGAGTGTLSHEAGAGTASPGAEAGAAGSTRTGAGARVGSPGAGAGTPSPHTGAGAPSPHAGDEAGAGAIAEAGAGAHVPGGDSGAGGVPVASLAPAYARAPAPAPVPRALGVRGLPGSGWEAVGRARAEGRPRARDYLDAYFRQRVLIGGDRCGGTDPDGMLCGFGERDGRTVAYAAQTGTATRPAGYRTAARLIRLADRLGIPVLTLVDTPGAANDAAAERQGVGAAIAEVFGAVAAARVPITTLVIGEGGSGGALALAAPGNTWATPDSYFSVIAPELAAAILKRPPQEIRPTADQLRIRPQDLVELGVVRGIVDHASP